MLLGVALLGLRVLVLVLLLVLLLVSWRGGAVVEGLPLVSVVLK